MKVPPYMKMPPHVEVSGLKVSTGMSIVAVILVGGYVALCVKNGNLEALSAPMWFALGWFQRGRTQKV